MKYDKFINIHVSYFDAHIKYFFLGEIEKIFWLEFWNIITHIIFLNWFSIKITEKKKSWIIAEKSWVLIFLIYHKCKGQIYINVELFSIYCILKFL